MGSHEMDVDASRRTAVTMIFVMSCSFTVLTSSIEACPRGLFLLDRAPFTPSPYSTLASSRTCVEVCPLGFYPSITLTNETTFSDLNAGSAEHHALLRCTACPSSCTTCLGPQLGSCYLCDEQWIREHAADYKHRTKEVAKATTNSTTADCRRLERIISRKQKRVLPESRSYGTAVLLVILAAMFSAVLVFSLYRLHWERRRDNAASLSSGCTSIFDWIPRFCERKKYSAIKNEDVSQRCDDTTLL